MTEHYDVIIIGAGPSGSSAARVLTNNGFRVLLLDRKKFPRIKSCCGFLTQALQEDLRRLFGEIPEYLYCRNRKMTFLCSSSGRNYYEVKGYGKFDQVYRDKFDEWLAVNSGADFLDGYEVTDLTENMDGCSVICRNGTAITSFRSRFVVCAAGANSRFRRRFDSSYKAVYTGRSIQNIYQGDCDLENDKYYVTVNKRFTDKAFSYLYTKDNNICIGSAWIGRDNSYFHTWYTDICKRYGANLRLIRSERCCVEHTLGPAGFYYGKGKILFVGEAAGLIGDWGIGIPIAVISGEKAGLCISGNWGGDLVSKYCSMLI